MKNYRFIILIAAILAANTAFGQSEKVIDLTIEALYDENDSLTLTKYFEKNYCSNEISFWTANGVSSLQYRTAFGNNNAGFSSALGVGYTHFFNKNWGIVAGLEYVFYQQKLIIKNFYDKYLTTDIFENPILYQIKIENYRENQFINLLNIPISALFQTGNNHKFYCSFGLKFGIPLSAKTKNANAILKTSGYYIDFDQTEIWQNDLGYGNFNLPKKQQKINTGIAFFGTFETGAKWNLGQKTDLYTGIFVDYSFNSFLKKNFSEKRFIEYNHDATEKPIFNSSAVFAEKLQPFAFGIKLKLAFPVGCNDLKNQSETTDFFEF